MNVRSSDSRYKTVEASVTKRYSNQLVGLDRRRLHLADATSRDGSQQQSRRRRAPRIDSTWSFKADRQLRRALRHPHLAGAAPSVGRQLRAHDFGRRAGNAFGLTATSAGNGTCLRRADPNANREDNIWVFDIAPEKTRQLHRSHRAPGCSSTCSTSPTATRRKRSAARRAWAT